MSSFICDYLFEVNEYPKYGNSGEHHTVKNYFHYDSDTKEYGYRSLVVPRSKIVNLDQLPEDKVILEYINNKVPFLRKITDFNNQTEFWIFEPVS